MSHFQSRWLAPALVLAGLCSNGYAVDGVVLIDQNRALAGNVTPGDAPGFPVTISLSGSYRLSGNLTVPDANTTAILITADNVTIDLNGFSILGPTVCSGGPPVTSCSPTGMGRGVDGGSQRSITVINGSVRGMGMAGIYFDFMGGGGRVENVHADSNGGFGIHISYGTVSGNTATGNGDFGIFVAYSTVSDNTATGNEQGGIFVVCPSSVVGNTATNNQFSNLVTAAGAGCALANNAAP
jgi:parallel beta-helix repeat protein